MQWFCCSPAVIFADISEASLLKVVVAAGAMPPDAENTNGVKEPCSTSRTRCS